MKSSFTSTTLPAWLTIGLMLLGMLSTTFWSYHKADTSLTSRVAALEMHRADSDAKIDHIQEQVDKLVDWALGTKK